MERAGIAKAMTKTITDNINKKEEELFIARGKAWKSNDGEYIMEVEKYLELMLKW